MLNVQPVTLTDGRIRLEPMALGHVAALGAAAADGELWKLRVTSVPDPEDTRGYVERALAMREQGNRLPFVVVDLENGGRVIGSTSYHDIMPAVDRLEIGWTWYARSTQRSHVNTSAKLLLLVHAFETLGAQLVGWRTDHENLASQRAIERLGAKKDGVLRHHALRRDGSVRDTVMYSVTAGEWPEIKANLLYQQNRPR
jgi:RimJ/RimL family protein N-acetyltransferase